MALSSKGITKDGLGKMPTFELHYLQMAMPHKKDSPEQQRLNSGMVVGEEGMPRRMMRKVT